MSTRHPSSPRDAATAIVRLLQEQGHVACFAGGCVRDHLMGQTPKDYDVATDAHPKEVAAIFRNTQFVGEAFGITLVRLMGHAIEVATFRSESGYHDRRRPSQVVFTNAREDAIRRDFTINGLFENPLAPNPVDRIIDYVGGQSDINARILRAIGNPDDRLGEDYLRMLRAVRFASRFELRIEDGTASAIAMHAKHLSDISRERIGQELQWMLTPVTGDDPPGRRVHRAIHLLEHFHLDSPVLDETHVDSQPGVVKEVLGVMFKEYDQPPAWAYTAVLAAWMLDRALAWEPSVQAISPAWLEEWATGRGKATAARLRQALVLSNEQVTSIVSSLDAMASALAWSDMSVAQRKRLMARQAWPMAWALLRSLPGDADFQAICEQIEQDTPQLIATGIAPPPLVTGADLIALGQKPGPALGRLLEQAYDAQLQGGIANHAQAIAWLQNALKIQPHDS